MCTLRCYIVCALALSITGIFVPTLAAQESQPETPVADTPLPFTLGDQFFTISAGAYFPLFLVNPSDGSLPSTNQTVGGVGSLQWGIYLNEFFSVGIETSYIFSFSPNTRLLSFWPTSAKVTFAPRIGYFLIPIWLDVGINFSYFEDSTKADLLLKGGVGFYWFFDQAWAIGLRAEYWFIPQTYDNVRVPAADTRLLNSLTTSIGVIYLF